MALEVAKVKGLNLERGWMPFGVLVRGNSCILRVLGLKLEGQIPCFQRR